MHYYFHLLQWLRKYVYSDHLWLYWKWQIFIFTLCALLVRFASLLYWWRCSLRMSHQVTNALIMPLLHYTFSQQMSQNDSISPIFWKETNLKCFCHCFIFRFLYDWCIVNFYLLQYVDWHCCTVAKVIFLCTCLELPTCTRRFLTTSSGMLIFAGSNHISIQTFMLGHALKLPVTLPAKEAPTEAKRDVNKPCGGLGKLWWRLWDKK